VEPDSNQKLPPFQAGVRSYEIRSGRMRPSRKHALEHFSTLYMLPPQPTEWLGWYQGFAVRLLEIGFGMGHATLQLAQNNPQWGILGLEVHPPGLARVLKSIHELQLSNLRVVRADAQLVLPLLPNQVLDGVLVYFPDPWPKRRHHRRRLVQEPFVMLLERILKPGGFLNFVTDWEPYALEVRELLLRRGWALEGESWSERPSWRPPTKFEKRALDEGRPIFELVAHPSV